MKLWYVNGFTEHTTGTPIRLIQLDLCLTIARLKRFEAVDLAADSAFTT